MHNSRCYTVRYLSLYYS